MKTQKHSLLTLLFFSFLFQGICFGQKSTTFTAPIFIWQQYPNACAINPAVDVQVRTKGYTKLEAQNDPPLVRVIYGDGQEWAYSATLNNYDSVTTKARYGNAGPHLFENPGTYSIKTIVSHDGYIDSTYTSWSQIDCKRIEGKFFSDDNGNCLIDSGEAAGHLQTSVIVKSLSAGWERTGWVSTNGYSARVPANGSTYTVKVLDSAQWGPLPPPICPASGQYTISSLPSANNDFGYKQPVLLSKISTNKSFGCNSYQVYFTLYLIGPYQPLPVLNYKVLFGDGEEALILNSTTVGGGVSVNHFYALPGTYSVAVIRLDSALNPLDSLIKPNAITVSDSCSLISGKIFYDLDTDCAFSPNDIPIDRERVQLLDSNDAVIASTYSNADGRYYFGVVKKTPVKYKVQYLDTKHITCPVSKEYVISSLPSLSNNFANTCQNGYDLTGFIISNGFRPAAYSSINIFARNVRCGNVDASIKFVNSPLLNITSATPPADIIIGDTLIWHINAFSPPNSFHASLLARTDTMAVIGDSIRCKLMLEPVFGDSVPEDNIRDYAFPIRNSCDPNMKMAMVNGSEGAAIAPDTKEIDYTIFFQNTGNDSAYNIFIMDTLDKSIDASSVEILSSSHTMKVNILPPGNILKFNFNNIMLVDSFANEPASHGFVSYKVHLKDALPVGTNIKNTAHIYFDFNPAVVTNTTESVLTNPTGIASRAQTSMIQAYPNPVNTELSIVLPQDVQGGELTVIDILGNIVAKTAVNAGLIKLKTADLSNGIYMLQINKGNTLYKGKVAIVH